MTAQQVKELGRADELPLAASYPEVDVQTNARVELGECSVHPVTPPPNNAPRGLFEISFRFSDGQPWQFETACSADCAHDELTDLRNGWACSELRLHLPADWVRSSSVDGDVGFARIKDCVEHLQNMRNPCRTGEGWDGFELCRKAAIAAVSQTGMRRIQDTESRAA